MVHRPLIESDAFPFEFLSRLGERESWRKEIHRPVYHVHKWWAKRLGSVFRGILLGTSLDEAADLEQQFYRTHDFSGRTVFDPFMGSGTTIGEAHKLGFTALGCDINPVAVRATKTSFGPLDRRRLVTAFRQVQQSVGDRLRELYQARDDGGRRCEVLYYFWVMQAECPACRSATDLFSTFIFARHANPRRSPQVHMVCPGCGSVFAGLLGSNHVQCDDCGHVFNPELGTAKGTTATCCRCAFPFAIAKSFHDACTRPNYRLYAKLVLTADGTKRYLPAFQDDWESYQRAARLLAEESAGDRLPLPTLELREGYNTRQAMKYGFRRWRDFFNDRQLLALAWLRQAIRCVADEPSRNALATLFSGLLEFNNLFASYKGEGTGAVRHMFSHHILKPERMSLEANVWGTPKSSGSFANLFAARLLRAADYQKYPSELVGAGRQAKICSPAFSGRIEAVWPTDGALVHPRGVYLSCRDAAQSGLPDRSVDLVVTDPPFFDNVHYSELADFFFAWSQPASGDAREGMPSTRSRHEVQDADAGQFAQKLTNVFRECERVLKDDGLLAFTYHHSRSEGWQSLAQAILGAGFAVVNSHPVRAELSVATPKARTKQPIQLDIILVCRKRAYCKDSPRNTIDAALQSAREKTARLERGGLTLSVNDRRVVVYGQVLTTLTRATDVTSVEAVVANELDRPYVVASPLPVGPQQKQLFSDE